MTICIIPARGGSKRIPRKNIKPFLGRPMIAWSVDAAQGAGCFERIVVSTDDAEIAETARGLGAEVPFLRPDALADDMTATLPVIAHAVDSLGLADDVPVCCLYPAAPFADPADLQAGLVALRAGKARFVLPVTTFAFPIQRALRRDVSGTVAAMYPEYALTRSQDLEGGWHDAGQFYWALAAAWRGGGSVFDDAHGIAIPRHRVQDIDTPEDWTRAEAMKRALDLMAAEA
ncbi:MAG: pseudaminic acid cytidylyltransferase [Paracoccaceae bacterium]